MLFAIKINIMKLIQSFLSKIIRTVYGQTLHLNGVDYPIYTIPPTFSVNDDRRQILPVLQVWVAVIVLCVFVITAIVLAVKDMRRLIEKKVFSISYVVYKAMRRILILAIFGSIAFSIIIFVIQVFYENSINIPTTGFLNDAVQNVRWGLVELFFILQVAVYTFISGLVYLTGSIKNNRFLWIGLSLFFIIPGIIIFLIMLPLNIIPALNKYLTKLAKNFQGILP